MKRIEVALIGRIVRVTHQEGSDPQVQTIGRLTSVAEGGQFPVLMLWMGPDQRHAVIRIADVSRIVRVTA